MSRSPTFKASIAGVGFWNRALPSWESAQTFARNGQLPEAPGPTKPSPQLLPANERRRAPDTVAVALEVALAACRSANIDPTALPSVFASTHGDLAITDYMATTLASDPGALSPTRFHNSVHNAAAGYWTIGSGATTPATAISAYRGSFAQGLLEAMVQLHSGEPAVLLVGYDGEATGPLTEIAMTQGLLAGALVLTAEEASLPTLQTTWECGSPPPASGPLSLTLAGNSMSEMLPLFDALALQRNQANLYADNHHQLSLILRFTDGIHSH